MSWCSRRSVLVATVVAIGGGAGPDRVVSTAAGAVSVAQAERDSGQTIEQLSAALGISRAELVDLLASVPGDALSDVGPALEVGVGGARSCPAIACEVGDTVDQLLENPLVDPGELLPTTDDPGELLPTTDDPRELLPTTDDPRELLPTTDDPDELLETAEDLAQVGGQDPMRCLESPYDANTGDVCTPADGPHCHGSLDWTSIYYRTIAGNPMYRMKGYNTFSCPWTLIKCTFKIIAGGTLITAGANAGLGGCAALGPTGALTRGGNDCECLATIAGITKVVYPLGRLYSHSPYCKTAWKVAVCGVIVKAEVESSGMFVY